MSVSQILYRIILYPLVQIIEISFFLINKLFGNAGIAVLGVSFVVTLLCLPLYIVAEHWQQVERNTVSKLKPRVDRIKKAFSGDEQYMMLTTYYRQNHYHPIMALRSSFGLLIQIPFFMAAYSCLSKLPELQGYSFLFIRDMGQPDALFSIGSFNINILPIAMTIINIIAGAIYTKGFPLKEKIQINVMALIFLVILYQSPAGLVLYWTMNNVFSLIKNIFYKLKNPIKVLYILMCAGAVFVGIYILFVYKGAASLKKRLLVAIPLFLLTAMPLFIKAVNWFFKNPLKYLTENKKQRFLLFVSSALGLTILTGLLLPSNLISSSAQEFSNIGNITNPNGFINAPFWQSFGIFIFWSTCIYFLFKEKLQTALAVLFSVSLICGLVNVFCFAGNYGSLDITMKFIGGILSQSKVFIMTNLLVCTVLTIIIFILFRFQKQKLIYSISFIFCFSGFVLSIINISKISKEYKHLTEIQAYKKSDDDFSKKFHLSKNGKNVVIFMLDRAESSYFEHILNDNPDFYDIFSGFTYYPNTVSYNNHTLMGAPALYGGYEYTPYETNKRTNQTLKEKHNQATLMIPRVLTEQADFTASMFDTSWGNLSFTADMSFTDGYEKISGETLCGRYSGEFKKSLKTYDTTDFQKNIERNLFFISLFREVPALFRKIVYYKGNWWSSENVLDIDSFIEWFSALYFMNQITDFDSPSDSLLIITNESTHSNYDINSLNLTDKQMSFPNDNNGYEINYVCLDAIGKWINLLKENQIYDNTKIIIVADHGAGYGPTAEEKYTTAQIGEASKDAFNPLFLVKDFNSQGKLKFDNSFMTNADTPAIAFKGIVDNPINPYTNKPLTLNDKENGVLITTDDIFMVHHSKSNNIFTVDKNKWFRVKDNIFKDENWTKEEVN